MRRELNAVKEGNAHFGELYIFEKHLCFDLKVFAFHKQWVLDVGEIVAFLKSQVGIPSPPPPCPPALSPILPGHP